MRVKVMIIGVLVLGIYVFGVHMGKKVQVEKHRQLVRQRAENFSAFEKNRSKGATWPKSVEFVADTIGNAANLVMNN